MILLIKNEAKDHCLLSSMRMLIIHVVPKIWNLFLCAIFCKENEQEQMIISNMRGWIFANVEIVRIVS